METQLKVLKQFGKGAKCKTNRGTDRKLSSAQEKRTNQKAKRLFRDVRIFVNTIKQAVDIMKQSGIHADMEKVENDDYIEYVVRIPK